MSTINLLPEDYLQRRSQRRANILCVILFAVVMAGVGGAAVVSEQSTRRTMVVRDRVNASYDEAAKRLAQMQELDAQKRKGIQKAEATGALLEKVPRSYLLAAVTRALPEHAALTKLELKPGKAPTPQAVTAQAKGKGAKAAAAAKQTGSEKQAPMKQQPPMDMTLSGWAATDVQVAKFITALLHDPMLTSVELSYSQEKVIIGNKDKGIPDLQIREFMVTVQLKPGVDVMDMIETPQPESPAETEGPSADAQAAADTAAGSQS